MKVLHLIAVAGAFVLMSAVANAQNAAANKAFFASSKNEVTVANVTANSTPVTLFNSAEDILDRRGIGHSLDGMRAVDL